MNDRDGWSEISLMSIKVSLFWHFTIFNRRRLQSGTSLKTPSSVFYQLVAPSASVPSPAGVWESSQRWTSAFSPISGRGYTRPDVPREFYPRRSATSTHFI